MPKVGSGRDSVGRAVASDTREAVRIQSTAIFFIEHLFTGNCKEKTKIKKKRPGMARFLNFFLSKVGNININSRVVSQWVKLFKKRVLDYLLLFPIYGFQRWLFQFEMFIITAQGMARMNSNTCLRLIVVSSKLFSFALCLVLFFILMIGVYNKFW